MQDGNGWTIHINVLDKGEGVVKNLATQQKVSLALPRGAESTVKDLIDAMRSCNNYAIKRANAPDLVPFNESELGYDKKAYGRGYDPLEESEWISTVPNPKPVNCYWNPSLDNPDQLLSEAGLCNEAELALINVICWRG